MKAEKSRRIDLKGKRFGKLVVQEYAGTYAPGRSRGNRYAKWLCKCDCGKSKVVIGHNLRSRMTASCGCGVNRKHGHATREKLSATYITWQDMKRRCSNLKSNGYRHYGGRGIRVCRRWACSFKAFLADMGERPENKTIDRKNSDGHYSCGHCAECVAMGWSMNCRWATRSEQEQNKRHVHGAR